MCCVVVFDVCAHAPAAAADFDLRLCQEREALETRSLPMRQYLVDNVLPLLTKGLLEVGRLRPEDPIDFLAEYLFKNDAKTD